MRWLSAAYAAVARARRRSFERHPDRQRHLQRPVISVGNIAVGGSGKTPAVAHIAQLLAAAGERPAILTRGYRRREPTGGVLVVSDGRRIRADLPRAGDEPLMLARALPEAAVLVGADRYLAGLLAERRFDRTVHLLDDGFQHVQLHRDIDIVLVAPQDLHDQVLPAGRLREDLSVLACADAVVVNTNAEIDAQSLAAEIGVATVFQARTRLGPPRVSAGTVGAELARPELARPEVISVGAELARPEGAAPATRILALAGIARPRRFFDLLAASGWRVAGEMTFADHHYFTRADLDRIVRAAREAGAGLVLTTEKDLVRLLPFRPFEVPIAAVPLELRIEQPDPARAGAVPFGEWLAARLAATRAARRERSA